jgi:molybdenum cofactor biosynthesis protein A
MELRDQFGRVHDYLRISLTERCNLRCFYCMPEEGIEKRPRDEFMTTEELLHIADTFVQLGVKKIRLTGGEPLVRKDAGKILKALSVHPVELGITTNGILVHQYLDDFLASGMKSINVSLDSLDAEKQAKISRRDYFPQIMDNIHLLLKNDFHVKVNAVIMQGVNEQEVADFVEWTKDLPLHVRFIEFMPFDGNQWNWAKKVSSAEMMAAIEARFGTDQLERIADRPNDTARNYRIAGYQGTFGMISPVTNPFCDSCNRIRLTADGKLKNCLFSQSETDLLGALRRGEDIVSLIRTSIWDKKAARGGMTSFELEGAMHTNRSMIKIGG